MVHRHFIRRQLARSRKQAVVFVLCVILSMITLVALGGFRESVNESLLKDARELHSGDIIIHSHYELSQAIIQTLNLLEKNGTLESARVYEFYSVVRVMGEKDSLLAKLKVVEPGYPFYGRVELGSKKPFQEVLSKGNIVVEQMLLDRLNVRVGDPLRIGKATLFIRDVILREPGRPVSFFSFGPRVFISSEDLDTLDLVKKGSRVGYNALLKVRDEGAINRIVAKLKAVALKDQERVETFRTARSRVKRFFDNFLFFLGLISIFTLLLAGIGMQSALTAFLRENEKTMAIMKTFGATSQFITTHYLLMVSVLGLIGTFFGISLGFLLQNLLPLLFKGFLPQNVVLITSWRSVLEGLLLGIFVVAFFAFLPLYRLKDLKPSIIFRKEPIRLKKGFPVYFSGLIIFLFFMGMVLWQLRELKIGLLFVLGVILLILITALVTQIVLYALKRTRVASLAVKQALKGLFRPRNATRSIIITLTAALSVIFSIYLIEENLDQTFVQSYPADAPNLFFMGILSSQRDDFSKTLGMEAAYYPIVRARITSINAEKIDREKERKRRGDNLAREFNLTYRNYLIKNETLIQGKGLFREDHKGIQVSILDEVTEIRDIGIGDRITFKIQGLPLQATVTSIRARTRESMQPYFYFVFPEETLKKAPQTIFTAVRIERDRISFVQNKMVSGFPNVSVIDVTETLKSLVVILRKLSVIVRFFTLFSIIAGILIIISSVFATRFARVREAVYFKILGAKKSFVFKVFTLENLFLGLVSALLALILSQVGSWIISVKVLDISYKPLMGASLLMIIGPILLVIFVGLLASFSILAQKPAAFIREHAEE